MSVLKAKSEESTEASNKLIQTSLLNSSVHCSYYACVQLMLHLLRSHFRKTDMEVDKESYEAEKGFHNWLINIIYKEFVKLNAVEAFQFQKMIIGLKFARNKADYKNEVIDIDQAKKASEISASTKSLLLKSFHS